MHGTLRHGTFKRSTALLLCAAVGSLTTGTAFAAKQTAPVDLTGTYNVATLTPLQRPVEFGDNLELTPERANQIVAENEARIAERERNRGPVTEAPPEGGAPPIGVGDEFRESSGAGNVGGYNNFWVDPGNDVFTVDGKFRTSIITDPPNGRMPGLTPAALEAAQARRALRRPNDGTAWWLDVEGPGPYDGPEMLGISERCILGFTGFAPTFPSLYNNFKRIVQTEENIMILIEMVHDARVVRMNSEHPGPEGVRRSGWAIPSAAGTVKHSWSTPRTFIRSRAPPTAAPRIRTSSNALPDSMTATCCTGSRSTIPRPGKSPGRASTSGARATTRCSNTPAMRATTPWAASCAVPGSWNANTAAPTAPATDATRTGRVNLTTRPLARLRPRGCRQRIAVCGPPSSQFPASKRTQARQFRGNTDWFTKPPTAGA